MKSSSIFFDVALFLLSSLVIGPYHVQYEVSCPYHIGFGVMAIFVCKGLTRNTEIGSCTISGDESERGIPRLARMSLINVTECCKMQGL